MIPSLTSDSPKTASEQATAMSQAQTRPKAAADCRAVDARNNRLQTNHRNQKPADPHCVIAALFRRQIKNAAHPAQVTAVLKLLPSPVSTTART